MIAAEGKLYRNLQWQENKRTVAPGSLADSQLATTTKEISALSCIITESL